MWDTRRKRTANLLEIYHETLPAPSYSFQAFLDPALNQPHSPPIRYVLEERAFLRIHRKCVSDVSLLHIFWVSRKLMVTMKGRDGRQMDGGRWLRQGRIVLVPSVHKPISDHERKYELKKAIILNGDTNGTCISLSYIDTSWVWSQIAQLVYRMYHATPLYM
jgi:hypothetical protein